MRAIAIASLTTLLFATTAFAEPPPGGYGTQPPPDGTMPPPDPNAPPGPAVDAYGQPMPDPNAVQVVEQTGPAARANHFQVGLQVMVPIFTNEFRVVPICEMVRCTDTRPVPGIAGQLFGGWEFNHGFSLRLGLGASFNRVEVGTRNALTNIWGFAQARYSFLNRTALVPFAQLGVQLNYFSACLDDDAGGCYNTGNRMTLGGFVGGGVLVELTQTIALEVGLNVNMSGKGFDEFFDTTPVWLSPFLGAVLFL